MNISELHDIDHATTYEEWRVTGQPGRGYPPYEFTWSTLRNPHLGEAEGAARAFMAQELDWDDGPHLHRRTVTITEWTPTELGE